MRARVYRNLDTPFVIYGFSPVELILLIAGFVLGGEIAQLSGISRLWAFVLTGTAAFLAFTLRKSMGSRFWPRLIRFVRLPQSLPPSLMKIGSAP